MYPMEGGGWIETVNLTPDQKTPSAFAAHYMGDEHALHTMGLKLIAGPQFYSAEEIVTWTDTDLPFQRLHRHQGIGREALPATATPSGKSIIFDNDKPDADHRHRRSPAGTDDDRDRLSAPIRENSVLTPYRLIGDTNITWCACSRGSSMRS